MKGSDAERTFDFVASGYADPQRNFLDAADDIHARLLNDGALVIRGASQCRAPGVFEKAIGALGLQTRDYVGGNSPRSTIQGNVTEATRTPSSWSVILHQEMASVKSPPEIIAFVCVEPAGKGGESVIGDMRKLEHLVDQVTLKQLTDRGLKLRRTSPCETGVRIR